MLFFFFGDYTEQVRPKQDAKQDGLKGGPAGHKQLQFSR